MVKLRNDLDHNIDFGNHTIMNNQIFEIKYKDVKNGDDILTNEQWSILQTLIFSGKVKVFMGIIPLSSNDGVRLIQELVSNPVDFAFNYLEEDEDDYVWVDPNIDENNDGKISRKEILDADADGDNDWDDLRAIVNGNIVD